MTITGILWDFDGTLADTAYKHMEVTKEIFTLIKPKMGVNGWPQGLSSLEEYRKAIQKSCDWKEMYLNEFGVNEEEANKAGQLWSEYQLNSPLTVDFYSGISQVIEEFSSIPQAICSLNCHVNIKNQLSSYGIQDYFKVVLGYNNLESRAQKPHVDSFIYCLQEMQIKPEGTIVYIGDHETDTLFAYNAQKSFQEEGLPVKIISIAACYSGSNPVHWQIQPDYKATTIQELKTNLASL